MYRGAGEEIVRKAPVRGKIIRDASFLIQETATHQAQAVREEAVVVYNREVDKVKEGRERVREVRQRRLDLEQEKRKAAEAIVAPVLKPIMVVGPS